MSRRTSTQLSTNALARARTDASAWAKTRVRWERAGLLADEQRAVDVAFAIDAPALVLGHRVVPVSGSTSLAPLSPEDFARVQELIKALQDERTRGTDDSQARARELLAPVIAQFVDPEVAHRLAEQGPGKSLRAPRAGTADAQSFDAALAHLVAAGARHRISPETAITTAFADHGIDARTARSWLARLG